jgi:hypothetical protein
MQGGKKWNSVFIGLGQNFNMNVERPALGRNSVANVEKAVLGRNKN